MSSNIKKDRADYQPDLFSSEEKTLKVNVIEYAVMHCDGASSGNPGHAGIGAVIDVDSEGDKGRYRISEYIGIATNNVAEYTALIKGLEKAASLKIKNLMVFLDSELIVRQINGVYRVKNKNLLSLFTAVQNLLKGFEQVRVAHVRREMNKEADTLATEGARKRGI